MRGWGDWTGIGMEEREKEKQKKLEEKKRREIAEMKRKRRDGHLDRVILNQKRIKSTKKYFVEQLPHNYDNKEQFNFEQTVPIGNEWNTDTVY